MHIAIINISYYPYIIGGAEVSVQNLAEDLAKNHQVSVITASAEREETACIHSVHVYRILNRTKEGSRIKKALARACNPYLAGKVRRLLESIQPDVVHTNNLYDFSLATWRIAEKKNIPVVHTLRDYSLIYSRHKFLNHISRWYSRHVTAVTAPSQYTLDKLVENRFFKSSRYRLCIPNAAVYDESRLEGIMKEKAGKNEQVIDFAYVGRFSPEKGTDWLIAAFHGYSGAARLHLFGQGVLSDEAAGTVKGGGNIISHGFVSQEQLKAEMEKMDVVVVPSVWDEPFGRVILDAYAGGCPVIITGRGGMPEITDDYGTGRILEQETDECLLEAMAFFQDREKIRQMFPCIFEKLKNYTQNEQTRKFLELYESLVQVPEKTGMRKAGGSTG